MNKEQKYPYKAWLTKNKGEDIYYVEGIDCTITEDKRLKFLPDAIVAVNVSKQFRVGMGGVAVLIQ